MELKIYVDGEVIETATNNSMSQKTDSDYSVPVMLTVSQTALEFDLPKHFIRQLALSGKVKAVRAGRKILINQRSVIDYFNNSSLDATYGDAEKNGNSR